MTPFMIVRHPFSRLVSAYEDKMLNPKPLLKYHKSVQNEIKKRRAKPEESNFVFPNHLLFSEKYQLLLKRKVSWNILFKCVNCIVFNLRWQQWKNWTLNHHFKSLSHGYLIPDLKSLEPKNPGRMRRPSALSSLSAPSVRWTILLSSLMEKGKPPFTMITNKINKHI